MSLALTIGGCLAVCTSFRRIAISRRRTARSTAVRVAVRVATEPFAFPAPPLCSVDTGREVLAHAAPARDGETAELLEFPIGKGWTLEQIATVIAEIESL